MSEEEPDLVGLKLQYDQIRQSNAVKVAEMARYQRQLDPLMILATKIDLLLAMLPPEDRFHLEIVFEQNTAGILDRELSALRRADLLKGVVPPVSGLLKP